MNTPFSIFFKIYKKLFTLLLHHWPWLIFIYSLPVVPLLDVYTGVENVLNNKTWSHSTEILARLTFESTGAWKCVVGWQRPNCGKTTWREIPSLVLVSRIIPRGWAGTPFLLLLPESSNLWLYGEIVTLKEETELHATNWTAVVITFVASCHSMITL